MTPVSVVIVDDDAFIRDVVSAALSAAGARVTGFAAAAEALAAVRAAAPDIIVLDYAMPGADGLSVLRELRGAASPPPRVVFLTAQEDAALIARLRAEGADVLAKPFDPASIAARILRHAPSRAPSHAPGPRDPRLDAVAANFRASLPRTMAEIDAQWTALGRGWNRAVADGMLTRVHRLAGSAGLFGLHEFGDAARAVEAAVVALLDGEARGEAADLSGVAAAMARLRDGAITAMGKAE